MFTFNILFFNKNKYNFFKFNQKNVFKKYFSVNNVKCLKLFHLSEDQNIIVGSTKNKIVHFLKIS